MLIAAWPACSVCSVSLQLFQLSRLQPSPGAFLRLSLPIHSTRMLPLAEEAACGGLAHVTGTLVSAAGAPGHLPALIPAHNQQGEDNSMQQSGNTGSSPAFSPPGYYRQQEGNSSSVFHLLLMQLQVSPTPLKCNLHLTPFPSLQQGSQGPHAQTTSASSTRESIPGSARSPSIRRLLARARLYSILPLNLTLAPLQRHFSLFKQWGSSELLHSVQPHFTELLSSAVSHTGDRNKVTTVVTTHRHHRVSISPGLDRQPLRWKIYTFPARMF